MRFSPLLVVSLLLGRAMAAQSTRPLARDSSNAVVTSGTSSAARPGQSTDTLSHRRRVRSTKRGAAFGAIAGGTLGVIGGAVVGATANSFGHMHHPVGAAVGTGLLCGAAGAISWGIIGAGIGSLFSHESPERVQVHGTMVSIAF